MSPRSGNYDPRNDEPYSAEKVRYRRQRLRERLSFARPGDMARLTWQMDRLSAGGSRLLPGFEPTFLRVADQIGSEYYVAPWELETILLEYLCVKTDTVKKHLMVESWDNISTLVNWVRYLENEQTKAHPPSYILEELARIAYRQFGYQAKIPEMFAAVRWWSILEEPELSRRISEVYGVDFRRVLNTSLALFQYLDTDPFRLPPPAVDATIGSKAAVERTLRHLSRDPQELRLTDCENLVAEMAYRESPLRRFPILRFYNPGNGYSYCAPIRALLWWRITSGLYYDITTVPDFQNRIGTQFERYIANLIVGTTGWQVRAKTLYQLKGFGRTESPDCVATNSSGEICAVVECKAVKSTLAAQIKLISEGGIDRAIAELAKGLVQILKYYTYLRLEKEEILSPKCCLVVATLDEWLFFGGQLKNRIFEKAIELADSQGLESKMLKDRGVVLCSASNLEYVLGHFSGDEVTTILRASSTTLPDYELRQIPSALNIEAGLRNRYIELEFERLIGRTTPRT